MDDLLGHIGHRVGHFAMESGHHADLWLDLDGLFMQPVRLDASIGLLAERLAPHDVSVFCGPLVGGAFVAQALGRTMGIDAAWTERSESSPPGRLDGARYALPSSLAECLRGRRVALVDDAMSAGSSLRATFDAVTVHGGLPVVVGALLVMGDRGRDRFAALGLPVVAVAERTHTSWTPDACPRCAAGIPLERPSR